MFTESSHRDAANEAPSDARSPRPFPTPTNRTTSRRDRSLRRPLVKAFGASLALGLLTTGGPTAAGAVPAPAVTAAPAALPTLSTVLDRQSRFDDLLPSSHIGVTLDIDLATLLAPTAKVGAANLATAATPEAPAPSPAPEPAPAPEPVPEPVPEPPAPTPGSIAVDAALTRLGMPYVWGASGPNRFDCSGLTMWAWGQAGVGLGHYTGSQYAQTQRISQDELQPGDLVFYWSGGRRGDPSHVGLYIGDGNMVHAPGRGRPVQIQSIYYWAGASMAFGRV